MNSVHIEFVWISTHHISPLNLTSFLIDFKGNVIEGQSKFGMAHCIFFAWFVDLQLHLGQNDQTLLRFAKTASIGWTSGKSTFVLFYHLNSSVQ